MKRKDIWRHYLCDPENQRLTASKLKGEGGTMLTQPIPITIVGRSRLLLRFDSAKRFKLSKLINEGRSQVSAEQKGGLPRCNLWFAT